MNQEKARALARQTGDWTINEIEAIDQFLEALYQERLCMIFTTGEIAGLLKKAEDETRKKEGISAYCECGAYSELEGLAGQGLFQIARIAEKARIFIQIPMTYCPACGKRIKKPTKGDK